MSILAEEAMTANLLEGSRLIGLLITGEDLSAYTGGSGVLFASLRRMISLSIFSEILLRSELQLSGELQIPQRLYSMLTTTRNISHSSVIQL